MALVLFESVLQLIRRLSTKVDSNSFSLGLSPTYRFTAYEDLILHLDLWLAESSPKGSLQGK